MRFHSYLNHAVSIIQTFAGIEPFHLYIKKYFSFNKKFGSNDRKQITSLCYNYFRLGKAAKSIDMQERILFGTFLCENKSSAILQFFRPEWNDSINKSLEDKLTICNMQLAINEIFPFNNELSDDIAADKFNQSFLIQPKLFLRIRPGYNKSVIKKMRAAGVIFELISESCIALPNSSKIDSILDFDKEAIVQDFNSQGVGKYIKLATGNQQPAMNVWDCCAGSGGKSIMAYDINPNIHLTVSDKRKSILQNLKKRFAKAGIKNYNLFVAGRDAASGLNVFTSPPISQATGTSPASGLKAFTTFKIPLAKHDLIIADVPCTGSGTWSRTPEQLFYFKDSDLQKYSELQKELIKSVIPALKPGGHLLYITCSVFKKENEKIVEFIEEISDLQLKKMELLKGYEMQCDTMFAALFTKPGFTLPPDELKKH